MKRIRIVFLCGMAAFAMAGTASAQDVTQQVVTQLEQQGFEIDEIRRTLLGRVRIIAERDEFTREIVFDPRNGVFLRDYSYAEDGETGIWGFGRGDDDDDDDDQDDRDDDRDDDDRDDDDDDDDSDSDDGDSDSDDDGDGDDD